jgi:site-specific DNA-adenine methylase
MSNYIRIIKYVGCKYKYLPIVEQYISKTKKKILVEPFCGSASISVNFGNMFDKVYINDANKDLIKILNGFKIYDYWQYKKFVDDYSSSLMLLKDKNAYYNFRNYMNKKYYGSGTFYESFYLYYISYACINSMFRCGLNGFNSSYGNRINDRILTKEQYNKIHNSFKNIEIYNLDYKDFFKKLNIQNVKPKDCLMFLDPPYEKTDIWYNGTQSIGENNYRKLLNNGCDILYTDILDNNVNLPYVELREMTKIKPGNGKKTKNIEVMYYKIEGIK